MKVNILVPTRSNGKFAGDFIHSSITGEEVSGPDSPEDKIITELDEDNMSTEQIIATRFIAFLSTRGLTVDNIKQFPQSEQQRIKEEFIQM